MRSGKPEPSAPSERCQRCETTLPPRAVFCPGCGARAGAAAHDVTATAATAPGDPLPPMRLAPGTLLGTYEIEGIIGEGGMGVVYRARDRALSRAVALKCLHANLTGDADIRRRFAREARLLREFSHPGVVAVHDFVEVEHLLAIVMELVEGPTLGQQLARWRGRMPIEEVADLFGDVLATMQDAHARGIVHRDLKPDNVLLARARGRLQPKIVDFGIAKVLEGTTYTVTGALLGTCRYMAPEQIARALAADHRADIYSLGVVLYELCTGRGPFEADSHFALMMANASQIPDPPSRFRADLPPELDRLVLDALAKDPAARPQSCAAFRARLEAIVPARPQRPTTPPAPLPAVLADATGEMVLVPAGPFRMGPERREVDLDAFYIDRTPVTNAQFRRFVDATGYKPSDGSPRFLLHLRGRTPSALDHHPVVHVSWRDAQAYAVWAGKRLPTEAEWEKAARGTDGRRYPWGNHEPGAEHANFGGKGRGTTPVEQYPRGASPYGVLDLAGNTWEWCQDVDDPAFYADGPTVNPVSPRRSDRPAHVMRGGCWLYGATSMRTTSRTSFEPHYRFALGGFRCVKGA